MDFTESDAKQIVVEGDVHHLVEKAKAVGGGLARDLTTSQIRNFFTEVRTIHNSWNLNASEAYRRTVLLKPKLAYAAQRAKEVGKKTNAVEQLGQVLTLCIDQVSGIRSDGGKPPEDVSLQKRQERFQRFMDFFEAVLAYHKEQGGKEF